MIIHIMHIGMWECIFLAFYFFQLSSFTIHGIQLLKVFTVSFIYNYINYQIKMK